MADGERMVIGPDLRIPGAEQVLSLIDDVVGLDIHAGDRSLSTLLFRHLNPPHHSIPPHLTRAIYTALSCRTRVQPSTLLTSPRTERSSRSASSSARGARSSCSGSPSRATVSRPRRSHRIGTLSVARRCISLRRRPSAIGRRAGLCAGLRLGRTFLGWVTRGMGGGWWWMVGVVVCW